MYFFKDQKGFIARPIYIGIITEEELINLKKLMQDEDGNLDKLLSKSDIKNTHRSIELFEKLELCDTGVLYYNQRHDLLPNVSLRPSKSCRTVLGIDSFSTTQGQMHNKFPPLHSWGWEYVPEICSYGKSIQRAIELVIKKEGRLSMVSGVIRSPEFAYKSLKKINKLVDQYNNKEFYLKEFDAGIDLVSADCFAIYTGSQKLGGFLDGRGDVSPLGGARLFESQAAAERTIVSCKLSSAIVVCIRAQLTKLAPDQKTIDGNIEPLQAAIASVERAQLIEALDMASTEQLEQAVTKKRKM